jgi:tetratricopeptide (TPR) repeat protein
MKSIFLILICVFVELAYAQSADEYLKEACVSQSNGDHKSALKSIEMAISLDDTKGEYYEVKGECLMDLNRFQEAYETFSWAILVFPERAKLYNDRGNIFVISKDYDLAIEDFTKAIELAGNDTTRMHAFANRGGTKSYIRDFEGAYEDLMEAYSYDSTDIGTLVNLGAICDEIDRGDETLKYLLKAVEVDSTYYPIYVNIGYKYQRLDMHAEAIKYFNKTLEFYAKDPLAYSNRSYSKLKLGDFDGALADIQTSIKSGPANSYAYWVRALIYIEKGKVKKACVDLQTALDKGFTTSYGQAVLDLQRKHCK